MMFTGSILRLSTSAGEPDQVAMSTEMFLNVEARDSSQIALGFEGESMLMMTMMGPPMHVHYFQCPIH